jgi:mannose-6-phosphate isomerase-like protein (cupin superfamily)
VKPTTALALLPLLLGAGWTALAEAGDPPPRAVLDARLGDARLRLPLDALPERVALAAGETFRAAELGRDTHSSHHVVAIRDAEVPHRHDRHDLLVVMLRGHGTFRQGDDTRPVGEGSILYVPRGSVHAFTNLSDAPAIAYAVYTPAFDGEDRQQAPQ